MLQNIIAANYNIIIHICQAENLVISIVGFACVSLASYRYYFNYGKCMQDIIPYIDGS